MANFKIGKIIKVKTSTITKTGIWIYVSRSLILTIVNIWSIFQF